MDDVKAIAEGLSEAQRKMLLAHSPHFGSHEHGWPGSAFDPTSFAQAGRPLMVKKLICWTRDPKSSMTMLTNMGNAVRAHLLSTRGDSGAGEVE